MSDAIGVCPRDVSTDTERPKVVDGSAKDVTAGDIKAYLQLQCQQLTRVGLKEDVARAVVGLVVRGKLKPSDLDAEAVEALNEAAAVVCMEVLAKFESSNVHAVQHKSAYICGLLKTALEERRVRRAPTPDLVPSSHARRYSPRRGDDNNSNNYNYNGGGQHRSCNRRHGYSGSREGGASVVGRGDGDCCNAASGSAAATTTTTTTTTASSSVRQSEKVGEERGGDLPKREVNFSAEDALADPSLIHSNGRGPRPDRMKEVLKRTKFALEITPGQRKYSTDSDSSTPNGTEVFICRIPRDVFEDDLIPLLESCGTILQMRIMLDPMTGWSRGFAFCKYASREAANRAVRRLDDHELRPARKIGVSISLNNQRLFVSNIPKNKDKDELHQEFLKHSPGLVDVIIYSSPDDRKKNRGFCFLEYENHKSASIAKRKLGSGRVKIWSCDIIVDWADPLEEPDEETMSKVKVLYVRNLTQKVTEDDLKEKFQAFGTVERVKKIKDYAFIHFSERENALRALADLDGVELCGAAMEVTLAKPPSDKRKKEEMLRRRELRMTHLMYNRGKFWNASIYGNAYPGAYIKNTATATTTNRDLGVNDQCDFGSVVGGYLPAGNHGGFGYSGLAAAVPGSQSVPDYYGLSMNPSMDPTRRMSYAQLMNAADFWDDFNDLDMTCSPLAPAAVPIPAGAPRQLKAGYVCDYGGGFLQEFDYSAVAARAGPVGVVVQPPNLVRGRRFVAQLQHPPPAGKQPQQQQQQQPLPQGFYSHQLVVNPGPCYGAAVPSMDAGSATPVVCSVGVVEGGGAGAARQQRASGSGGGPPLPLFNC